MSYIKGKLRNLIFESDSGYKVGLFRIKETDDTELEFNKVVTFTGYFAELNTEDTYILKGRYIYNDRYGYQYNVDSYERIEPEGKEAIIEFLSSSLIKGCGEKTAIKIVDKLGENALNLIKENRNNLLLVPGITNKAATKIYESILMYSSTDQIIVELKEMGFTIKEALIILNKFGNDSIEQVKNNIYQLWELIDFDKLDRIFLRCLGDIESDLRIKACIINSFKLMSMVEGNTYFSFIEIASFIRSKYQIFVNEEELNKYLEELIDNKSIIKVHEKYFLKDYYDMEENVAESLLKIDKLSKEHIDNFDELIREIENNYQVKYNIEQKKAIKDALENRITIITGGPGTGKTTIINAIVKLYINLKKLNFKDVINDIALLAPTGRASKKMAESTGLGAMTIHRYLKWNKEKNDFQVNELNKNQHKLIIVDEVSMIDINLFDALIKGVNSNIKLILVGDANQLPSVGPGNVLNDLINSEAFTYCPLTKIYRQSDNSYIPVLAREIKDKQLSPDFMEQKDDYNFLNVNSNKIKEMISKIVLMSKAKGLDENSIQILVPMYKGENGIDNLNLLLQDLYNPRADDKKESKVGDVIYREGDKVLQLVNNPDCNVFNGDIGFIEKIKKKVGDSNKLIYLIDFDGNKVEYEKDDLSSIKHAYAITIHKAQGSEFAHVIMPVCKSYYKMLYNKLLYTGVSRAKKSLVIIGEAEAFMLGINNEYSNGRKTALIDQLMNKI